MEILEQESWSGGRRGPPYSGPKVQFLFSAPIYSLLRTHLFSSPHPFFLFSAPFFLFSSPIFLFSSPIFLFSSPFFLFSSPVIVVTLLPIMQSYSVNSLWILECNHRLRVQKNGCGEQKLYFGATVPPPSMQPMSLNTAHKADFGMLY